MAAAAIIEETGLADAADDESTLPRRFAQGEAGAFERVVATYQARVAGLAYRLLGWQGDPEDVVQEVFLTALRNAGTIRGEASLWSWLASITVNRCRRYARRRALWRRFVMRPARRVAEESPAADEAPLADETSRRVREAVAALPARDREVIVLYYLEQCPMAEMCELLGAAPNALQVRLHRARAKLNAALAAFVAER